MDPGTLDYEVTEDGIFYEEEADDEGDESDPLASESDGGSPEKEAHEEVFGASVEDLIAEARGSRRRRKRKRHVGGGSSTQRKARMSDVPAHLNSLMGSATVAFMMKRFEEAEAALTRIIREAPKAAAPYRTLGLIYEEKGEKKKALETFMMAAELNKRDRDLWKRNAALWEEMGESQRAIYCLTMALRGTRGEDADALRARGMLYMKTKRFRNAADSFIKLSKLLPDDISIGRLIAHTYRLVEEEERAIPPLEAMLRHCEQNTPRTLDPDAQVRHEGTFAELAQLLVEIRFRQQRYYDASLLLGRLQARSSAIGRPMTFVQRLMLAVCQHRLGSETLASPTFLEFMSSPSMVVKHRFLLWEVADACRDSGDYRKGLRAYSILTDFDEEPKRGELYLRRAVCHEEMGNRSAAREDLQTVLRIDPGHVEASLRIMEFLPSGETYPKPSNRNSKKNQKAPTGKGGEHPSTASAEPPLLALDQPATLAEERRAAFQFLRSANALYDRGNYRDYLSQVYPVLEAALQLPGPLRGRKMKASNRRDESKEEDMDIDPLEMDAPLSSGDSDPIAFTATRSDVEDRLNRSRPVYWSAKDLSEAERAGLHAVGANLMRVLDDKPFVDVAERIVTCFREEGELARAHPVTRLFESLTHLRIKSNPALRLRMKLLDMATSFAAGDAVRGYEHGRMMLLETPLDPDICFAFSVADQQLSKGADPYRTRSMRFLTRLLKKNPTSLFLLQVAGNCSSRGGINTGTYTVGLYLRAFKLAPHNPLICLCAAVQVLYVALSRRIGNRNEMVMHAFAFLDDYRRNRLESASDLSKKWLEVETDYNVGRAMHQLGLVDMASEMYLRVLDWGGDEESEVPMWADLRRDAAYNLIQVYRASGSGELASAVAAEYLMF